MSNKFTEELRNFWSCLKDEQSLCGAFLSADFCGDGAQDFSLGRRMATAILTADFSYGGAILTAPKPLQDKALSKGGGGLNVSPVRLSARFKIFLTQARLLACALGVPFPLSPPTQ